MARYLLRRLLLSVPLLFLVSVLTFVMVAIVPGDPAVRILGAGHSAPEYQALDRKLGLTAPLPVQYWHWVDGVLHGSLGTSLFTNQTVTSELELRTLAIPSSAVRASAPEGCGNSEGEAPT